MEDKPEVPQLREDLEFYWTAWQDLRSERTSSGTIPWRAMLEYANTYGADLYLLKLIVWELDQAFVDRKLEQIKNNKGSDDG